MPKHSFDRVSRLTISPKPSKEKAEYLQFHLETRKRLQFDFEIDPRTATLLLQALQKFQKTYDWPSIQMKPPSRHKLN